MARGVDVFAVDAVKVLSEKPKCEMIRACELVLAFYSRVDCKFYSRTGGGVRVRLYARRTPLAGGASVCVRRQKGCREKEDAVDGANGTDCERHRKMPNDTQGQAFLVRQIGVK